MVDGTHFRSCPRGGNDGRVNWKVHAQSRTPLFSMVESDFFISPSPGGIDHGGLGIPRGIVIAMEPVGKMTEGDGRHSSHLRGNP